MRQFRESEDANVVTNHSAEAKVRIVGGPIDGFYTVKVYDYDERMLDDRPQKVHESKLRVLKGPHFDLRGQVLTTSTSHPNDIGEIVGTGTAQSGKKFFKVQFGDKTEEWFSEDQIFIDDDVKRKHDESRKR